MEKLPFLGEGFHIENRRLGSLFEDRRIRPKKNPKTKNPKKTQKKTQKNTPKKTQKNTPKKTRKKNPKEKNPYIYTIQAHVCLRFP